MRVWQWLTDPGYRKENGFSHPAAVLWKLIWFVPIVVTATLHCVFVMLAFGAEEAKNTWHDCTGL